MIVNAANIFEIHGPGSDLVTVVCDTVARARELAGADASALVLRRPTGGRVIVDTGEIGCWPPTGPVSQLPVPDTSGERITAAELAADATLG